MSVSRLWKSWRQWESAEVLISAAHVSHLVEGLRETGRALTCYLNLAQEVAVFVAWCQGPCDYVALVNREVFLADHPAERDLVEYLTLRPMRVELASVAFGPPPEGEAATPEPVADAVVGLLARVRDRCGLGPGLLAPLGEDVRGEVDWLRLHARHVELVRAARGRPPPHAGHRELEEFDRRLEEVRLGA